jgi:hypothetical protein
VQQLQQVSASKERAFPLFPGRVSRACSFTARGGSIRRGLQIVTGNDATPWRDRSPAASLLPSAPPPFSSSSCSLLHLSRHPILFEPYCLPLFAMSKTSQYERVNSFASAVNGRSSDEDEDEKLAGGRTSVRRVPLPFPLRGRQLTVHSFRQYRNRPHTFSEPFLAPTTAVNSNTTYSSFSSAPSPSSAPPAVPSPSALTPSPALFPSLQLSSVLDRSPLPPVCRFTTRVPRRSSSTPLSGRS